MNKNLGIKIKELQSKGYSYRQIVNELHCARSTVCYHLGDKQKQKYKKRRQDNRKGIKNTNKKSTVHTYTDEQLIQVVKTSLSIAQILKKLGLKIHNNNYVVLRRNIEKLKINVSHLLGKGYLKNRKFGYRFPIGDYLSNSRYMNSHNLKLRLIDEKILEHKCGNCGLLEWLGKSIPIELHHKDGNHKNNNLTNLQILCPNCHALTDNHAGKGIGRKKIVKQYIT